MTTITLPRAVVEQALHVAESAAYPVALIKALRAALAQKPEPVQEPVAEVFVRRDGVSFAFWLKAPPPERTKLYTAPPQQAEPVEPVAKVELMMTGGNAGLATRIVEIHDHLRERLRPGQQLYTAPPQRTMVPLTEEEIYHTTGHCGVNEHTAIKIARAVEQASWEKNHGQA